MEEVILLLFLGVFVLVLVMVLRTGRRDRPPRWDSSVDAQPLQNDSLAAGMVASEFTGDAAVTPDHRHQHHHGAYDTAAPFDGLVHESTHHVHHDMGSAGDTSHHDSGFDSGHHDGGGFDGGGFDGGGHHDQ
jgi:uncharacterized membrane protein YgcG